MKTHFNDPEYAKKIALLHQQSLNVFPPAIPFGRKKKDKEEDKKDQQYQKIDVPLTPEGDNVDTTEWKVPLFEEGDAEEWIRWRIQFDNLVQAYPLNTPDKQTTMLSGYRAEDFVALVVAVEPTPDGVQEVELASRQSVTNRDGEVSLGEEPGDLFRDHFLERFRLGRRSASGVVVLSGSTSNVASRISTYFPLWFLSSNCGMTLSLVTT